MTLRSLGLSISLLPALSAIASLGCAAAAPGPVTPSTEVAVVDLTAPAEAPKAAASAKPGNPAKPVEAGAPADEEALDAEEVAKNAGALGLLRQDAGALDSVFGRAALADEGAMKGLLSGDASGEAFGVGGLGLRGTGVGGGGTGQGTIGLGTIGGLGHGAGTGTGSGFGSGAGRMGRGAGGATVQGDSSIVLGALPKEVIQRIIRQHMNQIRTCYERALVKSPNLEGKVVVKFVIGKDGSVSSAMNKSSTLPDQAVVSCVVGRFAQMQFPQPTGGGIVIVSYPLVFKSAAPAPAPAPAAAPAPASP